MFQRALSPMALAAALLTLSAAAARAETPSDTARADFTAGTQAYGAKDYEAALAAFRRSFDAYPSPNARLAIARCLRELGRWADAAAAYEAAIDDARDRAASEPEYARARDAALLELERILPKVGRLRLLLEPLRDAAAVRVAGRAIPLRALDRPVAVPAGTVAIEIETTEGALVDLEVEIAAGVELAEHVDLTAAAERPAATSPREPTRAPTAASGDDDGAWRATTGWVSVAVAGAAFATYGVFYALADAQFDDLVAACVRRPCSETRRDDLEGTGRTYDTLSTVGLITGIATAAIGVGLLTWDALASDTGPDVQVGADGATFSVRGRF